MKPDSAAVEATFSTTPPRPFMRRSASRHRHPNPLTLVYETEMQAGGSRRYYAKVYRHGASLQALQGSAALPVPPLDMLLWAWPAAQWWLELQRQASAAHDTFWDFVSLMPETTHTLMWVMSDRGIPRSLRSLRMMQGFGVHTFCMVNAKGEGIEDTKIYLKRAKGFLIVA